MKKDCLRRLTAWLLAALLMISPALAEADGAEPALYAEAAAVDAVVGEADAMDLPADDAEVPDETIEGALEAVSAEAVSGEVKAAPAATAATAEAVAQAPAAEAGPESAEDPDAEGAEDFAAEDPEQIVLEKPAEKVGEKPAEKAEEKPAEKTGEKTVEKKEEKAAEKTEEKSVEAVREAAEEKTEEPVVKVTEEKSEEPVGEAAEEKSEEPVGKVTEEKTEEPVGKVTEEKSEEPVGEVAEEKSEEPVGEAAEEKSEEPVGDTPAEKIETETDESGEKPEATETTESGEKAEAAEASESGEKAEAAETTESGEKAEAAATTESTAQPEAPAAPAPEVVPAPEAAPATPLLEAEIAMGKGEKRVLTPACDPSVVGTITWASSKPGVVSVSQSGKLTARKRGSAVITVATQSGMSATCVVRVNKAPAKVRILPGKKLSMGVGETCAFGAKLSKGSSSALRWSSTNPAVVSVDAAGVATATAPGTAKIIVKTFNGKKAACKVRVNAAPTAVALAAGDQTLGVGMSVDMKPTVNAGAAANVTLSSDNPGVATVSGNKVTGVAPGTAVITATTYNGLTAAATVTVVPAPTVIALGYTTLHMGVGEKLTLQPATDAGTITGFTYKSSKKSVVKVSAGGVIKARKRGTATVTVTAYNGVRARVKVKVYKAPSKLTLKPKSVAMEPGGSYQLNAVVPKGSAAVVTFTSSDPAVVSVEGAGLLRAHQIGCATITAVTYNNKKATCEVIVGDFSAGGGGVGADGNVLTLSNRGMVMMGKGANWSLTASATLGLDGITWSTTSKTIASITADGAACTVKGEGVGTAIVGAKLPGGASASVIVMVVDTSDLSTSNFNTVQKALLAHEDLINSDAGGNVIWDMVAGKLRKAGVLQERVDSLITSLRAADASYRNLYLYSLGTYDISAENASLTASYFDQDSNRLNLKRSSAYSSGTLYDYVVFHESGHAADWNYNGGGLDSLNDEATSAVLSDVRNLLINRVGAATAAAGVTSAVDGDKVVNALMDYRTLLNFETVRSELGLSEDEVRVYNQLASSMGTEMNTTLPINNGCMVWDAVEGATNYAVHGSFGHYYLLKSDKYADAAKTYYYNLQGTPTITTEPWAEFFSANVMGDSNTLEKNWSYLPQTCKYFAETFVPRLVGYFTEKIKNA